jgi:transposase InsO family protein
VSQLIDAACAAGARLERACDRLGLSPRTLQRWRAVEGIKADGRAAAAQGRIPANRLRENERLAILALVNQPEFADQPPSQIVPALADQGRYLGSEATFYRVMKTANQVRHRGQARPPTHRRPEPLTATAPHQVWSWDITYLATTVKGLFFYLYLFLDVYSRKIVGWEVFASESAAQAATVLTRAYHREGVTPASLVLHADNGGPMKGATLLATLQRLGVMPSFSRPSVSDDNPFSEALFKTLKYHPGAPSQPFACLEVARQWVAGFVTWYNEEHRHSALQFVTPGQRHRGEDRALLNQRRQLYAAARARHPERWSGPIRQWQPVSAVCLNPGRSTKQEANNTPNAT